MEQTQGDKLNEIKAQRLASTNESESDANKVKLGKLRRRLGNVTNTDVYGKAKASTSKKHETETMLLKRSHYEQQHMYPSRN